MHVLHEDFITFLIYHNLFDLLNEHLNKLRATRFVHMNR
jgi:hypothetical protein